MFVGLRKITRYLQNIKKKKKKKKQKEEEETGGKYLCISVISTQYIHLDLIATHFAGMFDVGAESANAKTVYLNIHDLNTVY